MPILPRRRICPPSIIWAMCRGTKTRPPRPGTRGSNRDPRSARCSARRCPACRRRRATPISTSDRRPRSRRRSPKPPARRASTRSASRGRMRFRARPSGCAQFLAAGAHGDMDWMAQKCRPPRRSARAVAGRARDRHARRQLRPAATIRWRSCASARAAPSRSMPKATIITTSSSRG